MPTSVRRLASGLAPLVPSLIQSGLTGLAYAQLHEHDLVGDVSVWSFLLMLGAASVVNQFWGLTLHRWGDRRWWLHGSLAANVTATTTIMYATGWGAALVTVGYLVSLSERARTHPTAAWRVGLVYALAGIGAGQAAVEWGVAPTEIETPLVHGLAGLTALGLAFVAHQLDTAHRHREEARRDLQRNEERFRALVQNASDMVVVTDVDDELMYASPSVVQTGFSPEALSEIALLAMVHPDDAERAWAAHEQIRGAHGATVTVEMRARHTDGTWHWYEVVSQNLLADPAVRGVVSNVRDVTERKLASEALARHAEQLERTNAELLEAQRVKDEFVATVSHELRTPLTAIIGFADTLHRRRTTLPDAEIDEFVDAIQRQSRRLHRMVEDLLVLSRVAQGDVVTNPGPVELSPALAEIIEAIGGLGDSVPRVEVPAGLAAEVDRDHFQRMVENLLTNAVRHGAAPFEVTARRTDEGVVVTVADHGPGIPAGFEASLFDKFTHASGDGISHGLGLGLAIVRSLAEANGGRVWYEPGNPTGARFHLLLPAARRLESHPVA